MRKRHSANAPGDWYVDTDCIDCSASSAVAPGLIAERAGQCVFARQPETADDLVRAWRARLLCPTASIHTERPAKAPPNLFPEHMTGNVYRLGYNARSAWGAHSFAVVRGTRTTMIDAPRWTGAVVHQLEAWGGLSDILLTHRDDVGDAARYAAHFKSRVWIHEADRDAARFATDIIAGRDTVAIDADWLALPVPGHTRGSVAYLHGGCLFTGDSLAWSFEDDDLAAWRDVCWWSWPEQTASLRRLLDHPFEWVFAGHGASGHLPAGEMRARLAALVERMPGA
jgi:glyoxylase-like metal-dependent hydrolase (beta-lactamase superfamily II)